MRTTYLIPLALAVCLAATWPAAGVVEWGTYHNYTIGDAITVVGTTVGPIPEPASLSLLALGGLALLRKRR